MKRVIRFLIALMVGLLVVLLTESTIGGKKINTTIHEFAPTMEKQTKQLVNRILPSPSPTPPPLDAATIIKHINAIRTEKNTLNSLKIGKQTCAVLHMYTNTQSLTTNQIHTACPSCGNLSIFSFAEPVSTNAFLDMMNQDVSMSALFTNPHITHVCAESRDGYLYVAAVKVAPTPSPITPSIPKEISETELWQALSEYRKDHQVPELSHDEKLCIYARKRLQDQLDLLATHKPAADYPVPAKYPLDAHDGFKRDANSEYVFEVTNRSVVAENLAYWPTATYGVHVIEWGWDTSTEGHRETQLSTEYTAGCVTGHQGFYVAIFAK